MRLVFTMNVINQKRKTAAFCAIWYVVYIVEHCFKSFFVFTYIATAVFLMILHIT